jgi:hypothetical protein
MTTTETPAVVTSQGSGSPGEGRNALVFVPGISRSWGDRSLRQIADDIVVAMNRLTTGHEFAAAPADPIAFSAGDNERSARRISITRIGTAAPEAKPVTVLDLVELEYARALAASNEAKPLLVRAILVLYALVRGARQFLGILNPSRQGKSRGQRIQLLFLFFILGVYAAFLGILVAAIVDLALQALATAQAALGGGATAAAGRPTPSLTTADPLAAGGQIVHFLSLAAVVVWTVLPPKARVKEGITNTATDFLTMDYYLRTGLNAPRLQGDLYGLLDALRDGHPEGSYRRIDVASYSLGSIVAFNALFPYGSPPAVGSPVAAVDTFVTIGCPFDTIRLVRPGYFHGRRRLAGAPRRRGAAGARTQRRSGQWDAGTRRLLGFGVGW